MYDKDLYQKIKKNKNTKKITTKKNTTQILRRKIISNTFSAVLRPPKATAEIRTENSRPAQIIGT